MDAVAYYTCTVPSFLRHPVQALCIPPNTIIPHTTDDVRSRVTPCQGTAAFVIPWSPTGLGLLIRNKIK